MNIPPIRPNEPTFGINITQKQVLGRTVDVVKLQSGKTLEVYHFSNNGFHDTLLYLKDSAGKFIKSKLKMFKGKKLIKTIRSTNYDKMA